MSDLFPEQMVPICVTAVISGNLQLLLHITERVTRNGLPCPVNQPLNRRILSGHLIEVDSKTLTIRYKFIKFNNWMFPSPILTVFALPHSSNCYTVGTPLKFYIKVYNTKRSPIFGPNGDSLNFQNMSIKWEVPRGGGGG